MATTTIKNKNVSINNVQLSGSMTSQNLKIGYSEVVYATMNLTEISSGSGVQQGYMTLTTGTWIIQARLRFPNINTTGKREIYLSGSNNNSFGAVSSVAPLSTGQINVCITKVHTVTASSETVTIGGYQNSGSKTTPTIGTAYAIKI